jgi:hypothetical protein
VATKQCPECNGELPEELGQHSVAPLSGLVTCPHCGAQVSLDKPAGAEGAEGGHKESFSGHETLEGVMDEVDGKEGGRPS